MASIDKSKEISEFFKFQTQRKITNLYKNLLIILEDIKNPPYNLKEEDFKRIRKKILDCGNDTAREIEQDFDKISIYLK